MHRRLSEATGDDVRLAQILGFRAISRWVNGDVPGALLDAREGLQRAERVGDPRLVATALSRVGLIQTMALEVTPGLLQRAVAIEERLERPLLFHDSPRLMSAVRLTLQDEPDRAAEMFDALERDAVARGDEHARAWAVLQMIHRDWYAGRWRSALEHAAVALEMAAGARGATAGGGLVVSVVDPSPVWVSADLRRRAVAYVRGSRGRRAR